MASLTKQPNGRYKVRWRDSQGERSRTVPSKRAAQRLIVEIEEAAAFGRDWKPEKPRKVPRLRRVMAAWLINRATSLRPATIHSYSTAIESFVSWVEATHGPRVHVDVLSRDLLHRYYGHLSESSRKKSTQRRLMDIVYTAWAQAHKRDDELEDGAWMGLIPRPRRPDLGRRPEADPVRAPTWAHMDALIGELRPVWARRLAVIMRSAGLRRGAVFGLRWGDVDLDEALLTVRQTKGGYGNRIVPIAPALVPALKAMGPGEVGAHVVPFTLAPRQVGRHFRDAWERAGVPAAFWKDRTTHALRKGFASGLRRAGADTDAVELLIGHSLGRVKGAYLDPGALGMPEAVALVPPLPSSVLEKL